MGFLIRIVNLQLHEHILHNLKRNEKLKYKLSNGRKIVYVMVYKKCLYNRYYIKIKNNIIELHLTNGLIMPNRCKRNGFQNRIKITPDDYKSLTDSIKKELIKKKYINNNIKPKVVIYKYNLPYALFTGQIQEIMRKNKDFRKKRIIFNPYDEPELIGQY